MGRTLHWSIEPREKLLFDEDDLNSFYRIEQKVQNSCEWTCDSFTLMPRVFPNWGKGKTWEFVETRSEKLLKQGLHPAVVNLEIVREGTALSHTPDWRREMSDFCKVAGNELNAKMVVLGLAIASVAVKCRIRVSDEGEFLICPIVIESGKARPDTERIDSDIAFWMTRRWDIAYKDCDIDWEKLAKNYYDISKKFSSGYFPPKCEYLIKEFCREVKPEDFKDHPEFGAAQIMAGFDGEYYGLAGNKDSEAESYRRTALIQKMLGGLGGKLEVAPPSLK